MARVKRGIMVRKRHKKILKLTKGYRHGRKNLIRLAKQAILKAGTHAYRHRRQKKREFRRLWIVKINAASREHGLTYSQFMAKLKKSGVSLDRKILAELAVTKPPEFKKIVDKVLSE